MFKIFDLSLNKIIYFENLKNFLIILTFFGLWLSTRLNVQIQDYLAYTFILTFGVLHGANDLNILARFSVGNKKNRNYLLGYIIAVVVVVLIFFLSKPAALLFFLLISGYHFGEQHLRSGFKGPFWLAAIIFLFYGLSILFLIFHLRVDEVIPIFLDITGITFEDSFFKIGLYALIAAVVLITALAYWRGILEINPFKELFLILVFVVVFKTASLVWAFCIYFIVWHSIPSLYDQMIFLYGNASKSSVLRYLKASWFYWFLSVAALGILYLLIGENTDHFITVVLYILAAITFPHVLVMSKIEITRKSLEN